jgi:hypothetical protein
MNMNRIMEGNKYETNGGKTKKGRKEATKRNNKEICKI